MTNHIIMLCKDTDDRSVFYNIKDGHTFKIIDKPNRMITDAASVLGSLAGIIIY